MPRWPREPNEWTAGHVEGAQRTMSQEVNTLQRAAQFLEQSVHLGANAGALARRDQTRDRGAVTTRDLLEQRLVTRIGALG